MTQTTTADYDQTHDQPKERNRTVIASGQLSKQVSAYQLIQADLLQVSTQQLEPDIRREAFTREFDGKITIDSTP